MPSPSFKTNRNILLGQDNNALVFLFAVNILVFLLINLVQIIYYLSDIPVDFFYKQVLNWFTLPAIPDTLLTRPWTVFVYMFTHHGLWHLISSSLWLWCFGFILQDLAGNNKLIPVYLYGGFTAGIVFIGMNNLFPVLANQINTVQPLIGAGPAIMAVAVATTTLAPGYRIFPLISGGIPLWVLTIIFVAIDFATLAGGNAGVSVAHLAAGLAGFLFVQQLRRGNDWGAWMNNLLDWLNDLFNPEKKQHKESSKEKSINTKMPAQKTSGTTQQKLDAILDKINQYGFQSLSDKEKDFLRRAGDEK